MDSMKVVRLVVSAVCVLTLVVGLVLVACFDGSPATITVLAAALTIAVPNLMTQLAAETAAGEAKKDIRDNTALTAANTVALNEIGKAAGVQTTIRPDVQDILTKSLPRIDTCSDR